MCRWARFELAVAWSWRNFIVPTALQYRGATVHTNKVIKSMNALRLLAAAVVVMSLSTFARADDAIAGVRRFEITYTAAVKEWPADAKQVVLWVPLPRPTAAQAVSDVEIQLPDGWSGRQSCDDDGKFGNRVLCL